MKIDDLIKSYQADNKSKEDIYLELLKLGYKVDQINAYFLNKKAFVSADETQKRTIHIIVLIGAVLVGAGIFSFVASNWQEMSKHIKILIILVSMLASYISGWFVSEKYELRKTGHALFFLGTIIYGSGIFLIAQIFNISANWPDGFMLWMVGVLLIANVIKSRLLVLFGFILGLVSIIGYPFVILRSVAGGNPVLLSSTFILFLSFIIVMSYGNILHKKSREKINGYY